MKIAYTSITIDYFAHALALGDSIRKYNPDYTFVIGLIDKRSHFPDHIFSEKYPVVEVDKIDAKEFLGMSERYTLFELSCAMKPFFAEYLIQKHSPDILLYFDSDILVYNNFTHLEEILNSSAVALTPHVLQSISDKDLTLFPQDSSFIGAGVINTGFIGMNVRLEQTTPFLKWWKEKLVYQCLSDKQTGLFLDQKWLNLALLFFDDTKIIRHPGYNIAHYNLQERSVSLKDDTFYVNDQYALMFYHYTGYDWKQPNIISKYQNRFTIEELSQVNILLKIYTEALIQNGVEVYSILQSYYHNPLNEKFKREKDLIAFYQLNIKKLEKELSDIKNTKLWKWKEKVKKIRSIFINR